MLFPFIAFWVLLILGRDELGASGIVAAIAVWGAILVAMFLGELVLVSIGIGVLDIVLVLTVFKGDIRIR